MAYVSVIFTAGIIIMAVARIDTADQEQCLFKKDTSTLDCSATPKLNSIPKYKNTKEIKTLKLWYNTLHKGAINKTSFDHYRELKTLEMISLKTEKSEKFEFHRDAFLPLKKLLSLNMSGTKFNVTPNFEWPKELTTLCLSNTGINNTLISTESLLNLNLLDVSNNSLAYFPKLHKKTPLKKIILDGNPIKDINVSEVAPYCDFQFHAILSNTSEFIKSECRCIPLLNWLKLITPNHPIDFNCRKIGADDSEKGWQIDLKRCNLTKLNDETQYFYNACKNEVSILEVILYAIVFSILFPVMYFANEAYNKYMSSDEPSASSASHKRSLKSDSETGEEMSRYDESSVYEKYDEEEPE